MSKKKFLKSIKKCKVFKKKRNKKLDVAMSLFLLAKIGFLCCETYVLVKNLEKNVIKSRNTSEEDFEISQDLDFAE